MAPKGFRCDAGEILFKDCLMSCPLGVRCLSLPTLRELSAVREWKGKPSTTQLLKGTREAYLEIKHDYFIDPYSQAYRLLGVAHHSLLEKNLGNNELGEERIEEEFESGQADYYDGLSRELIDYKTLGSYKVAQVLGMDYREVESDEVYVIGAKKGQYKIKKEWFINPKKADNWEYSMQVNRYRIMYESLGFPVDYMRMQVIVRDGGTSTAASRGVDKLIYMIDIPRIDDTTVLSYFSTKSQLLRYHVGIDMVPDKCSDKECWNGLKCDRYCNVKNWCF